MKKVLSLVTLLATTVHADWGPVNFQISKHEGNDQPTITAPWGSWIGLIQKDEHMEPSKTHELIFEFETPNYFTQENIGHFAVGIRANSNSNGLEGRGIIIGNVSLYNPANPPCEPTSVKNTIAIEHFLGPDGNCVYGKSTQGPTLFNNTRYRAQLISQYIALPWPNDFTLTRYNLWEKKSRSWKLLKSVAVHENLEGPTYRTPTHSSIPIIPPLDSMGFFFLEVFSEHNWEFDIYNMTSKSCYAPQCSWIL